jgi:AGZA family xanthine/uracil permease-like MFS transporter
MTKSELQREALAGLTNFLATCYIVIVNPLILSQCGMPFEAVVTATVMLIVFSTLLMGLYAKMPIVVAPGMGLNAFFTFSIVLGHQIPWQTALGMVFWSGIFFLLISIFNVRTAIVKAIPQSLRYGIASGIGLFIALIGLSNASFVVASPATLVTRGPLTTSILIFVLGFLVTSIFLVRKNKAAFILGIILTTLCSIPFGLIEFTDKAWVSLPDFSLLMAMDLAGSFKLALIPTIMVIAFTDLFDSISTFMALAEAGNLFDKNGEPKNVKQSLIVDALATTFAGVFGTSPGTAYIESAAGITQGGRTGTTAVVTALLFLPCMFFAPMLSMIPKIATAPILILVGAFMISPLFKIKLNELDELIPAFLALILIPLTYSITQGVIWSFLCWTALKIFTGKIKEVSPALIIIDILMIFMLLMNH